jgi:alanine dehydrogenase
MGLADYGVRAAAARDPGLRLGINVAGGRITNAAVATSLAMPLTPLDEVLGTSPAPA